jgi:trimethylamine--corrinoid protein Co-methyltransferase
MQARLQVMTEDEKNQVHERTLNILARTGVRVDSTGGREILKAAGFQVDETSHIVKFTKDQVEAALKQAPEKFTLGARRPGWDVSLNTGECNLLLDGEGITVLDRKTGRHRDSAFADWLEATRLADALDDIGMYWRVIGACDRSEAIPDYVGYLVTLFRNFSKHIQDPINTREQAPWFLEVLQTIFGSKESIRKKHPLSYVLCPQSPLVIDDIYTDVYLELIGWNIPVAIMPMPLMGATAPASMISTLITANCEILATLCLIQAAEPGTPVIYASVAALMDPRTGMLKSDAIESGILSAATVEMARYYGLPVETTGSGTSQFVPNIRSGYDRALSALTAVLSWPDILVGAGLLGGALILSLEQMLIDTETFRLCRQAHRGVVSGEDKWLDDVIDQVGPGGHFLDQASTVAAIHDGEWYFDEFGMTATFEEWKSTGRREIIEDAREKVDQILAAHQPLPLDEEVERELERIKKKAKESHSH